MVLTPVHPNPKAVRAFASAAHPIELENYGERAWCRLETYVFMCLAEVTMRPTLLFAFGLCYKVKATTKEIPEDLALNGRGSNPWTAWAMPREQLKLLTSSHTTGAKFNQAELPSSGVLTVEVDRAVIHQIEDEVHDTYTDFVMLAESERFRAQADAMRTFSLHGKQIRDQDFDLMADLLKRPDIGLFLHKLDLAQNLFEAAGATKLVENIILSRVGALSRVKFYVKS